MKNNIYFCLFFILSTLFCTAQNKATVTGTVVNSATGFPMANVNIVNLERIVGTATDTQGRFEISANVNDTLHFSYLGFKSIKVRVTNDWLNFGNAKIELTELAMALEPVVVKQLNLTGYLALDMAQIPEVNNNFQYSISGLPSSGYEARKPNAISKVLRSIFNPVDFLYRVFGKKAREMRKLRKLKKNDEIRNLLASRFDREMLTTLLGVERVSLDEIIQQCNYSKDFIQNANDLQILDAINECYEEYRVLKKNNP